ncbi:MAG: hypothetical protein HQL24_01375 [Candidatus Omnitrophica bacterium]|nr:hypothetical protein [Candidatus Omnitrophota bacterium]
MKNFKQFRIMLIAASFLFISTLSYAQLDGNNVEILKIQQRMYDGLKQVTATIVSVKGHLKDLVREMAQKRAEVAELLRQQKQKMIDYKIKMAGIKQEIQAKNAAVKMALQDARAAQKQKMIDLKQRCKGL